MKWDILCRVVDNHGDLGVCWRLAADLATRGHAVRLWCDDLRALAWMAPQGHPGVSVQAWPCTAPPDGLADVVVEAFGCEPPASWLAAFGESDRPPVWINLEYLSAQHYVARSHALPSPILAGPAAGRTRWFYYPGFTRDTGGLLREPSLMAQRAAFDRDAWRQDHGVPAGATAVSLFCYEPPALSALLDGLRQSGAHLLVTPGRATAAVKALPPPPDLQVQWLVPCPQPQFDALLWGCDLNFVRGEDSLVRALWAGQPFVWQIYPQDDGAHHDKLEAFLDWLGAPPSLRRVHAAWNGQAWPSLAPLSTALLEEWRSCALAARDDLLGQADLSTQLLHFVEERR